MPPLESLDHKTEGPTSLSHPSVEFSYFHTFSNTAPCVGT
jgi:hypothetical protein